MAPTPSRLLSRLMALALLLSLAAPPLAAQAEAPEVSAARLEGVARAGECPGAPNARLQIGKQGMVRNNSIPVGVRTSPATVRIGYMHTGQIFDVLDGPVCATAGDGRNYNWWRVKVHGGALTGWAPEGSVWSYWLWPYSGDASGCATAPAQRMQVGKQGVVRNVSIPVRVRNTPAGARVGYVYWGSTFDVIGGPTCANPGDGIVYSWWEIKVHGSTLTGWVPEGSPWSYWLWPYP